VVEEVKIRRGVLKESLGARIKNSESLVTISNVVTPEEIDFLTRSTVKYANRLRETQKNADRAHCCVRMPHESARLGDVQPGSTQGVLPKEQSLVLDTILERVFSAMDDDQMLCPSLKSNVFLDHEDANVSVTELFRNNELEFSVREPAMNVYFPRGHFGLHKDGRTLTILVTLSDPSKDYTDGGTGFFKEAWPQNGMHEPKLIMRPQPGTALIFGGQLSHKGLHNKTGTRLIIVGSFSRRTENDNNRSPGNGESQ